MDSIAIIQRLVAFPTVSQESNLNLIDFVVQLLRENGVTCRLVYSQDGRKASLLATIGPDDRPGAILSGHTDVVTADDQSWTKPPFSATRQDGKLYGRGTADMKGFVGCAISAALKASKTRLNAPLYLALSYDEEIGCVGVRGLLDSMVNELQRQSFCIVGEPTNMNVAIGHKGKVAARVTCVGRECHSALAPTGINAIHLGCEFVEAIRREQAKLCDEGARDASYEIPYTTLHVGTIKSGGMLNIVPSRCELEFEIRNVAAEIPEEILSRLRTRASEIANGARTIASEAAINIDVVNSYPGLNIACDAPVVHLVKSLTGDANVVKVPFGTEAGLFLQRLGVPTIVCGPGSMQQGHKPDEFIEIDQIDRCDKMLDRLIDRLASGHGFP
ncbi:MULTISPECIES: acetylornithine deacetylase [Bradyrhizobium]|uniref:Acetylornithine deacetylase n=3 Tax=Bradyrhizobium TaxID=374 RepID=A0A410VIV1_9BRAD|nr:MULTISPECIES: acetylornithine deacetylase [Bradyrhizobium]MCG2629480.1 acetylornithine deacetylase [Bradyrhizobium zhengyangense]MCG2644892.1 acetylornithine deacetylase [Bradyrhizobium zhengyangense]MCG2670994.1 acetylornithine deacetylase [Bradyrhizobium zhengyangense]MDN4984629.1 acetylornithine deacetylase [Bradyrhizobium sp. WYCCWR 13022]MDN5002621.1 acetylornithine deacetylase [Bradyrhizobium sp. WYCCWR 12677]